MDKEEIINIVESLNFSKGEYYIIEEAALVLYEIRKYADMINLYVSEDLFRELKDAGKINLNRVDEVNFYQITEEVAVSPQNKKRFEVRMEGGFPLQTLKSIVLWKRNRNEPKDQIDLTKIEEYTKKHNIKLGV